MSKELVDIGVKMNKKMEEMKAELEPSTELMREVFSDTAETIKVEVACNMVLSVFALTAKSQRRSS